MTDDASHYGAWSWVSYEVLLPRLKPGGLYVVEDWATVVVLKKVK